MCIAEFERKLKARGVTFYPDPEAADVVKRRQEVRKQIETAKDKWFAEARKQRLVKIENELKSRENTDYAKRAQREMRTARREEARRIRLERITLLKDSERIMPQWVRDVISDVCEKHDVMALFIISKCRAKKVVSARNEIAYTLRATTSPVTKTKPSFPRIGQWMGGRDHSSIVHAVACHSRDSGLPALTSHMAEMKRMSSMEYQRNRKRQQAGLS